VDIHSTVTLRVCAPAEQANGSDEPGDEPSDGGKG
jgi:hypothetical protein